MEGWVKLHKRLRDHELLRDDVAFKLFTILLLYVNTQTGKYTAGRYQLAEMTGIKPITVYKALKRLEKKWKMVTLVSNNQFTEITVSNWGKYQSREEVGNSDGNNAVTPREQRGNTNKEIRYKKQEYMSQTSCDVPSKPKKDEDQPMTLEQFVTWCKKSPQRHVQIIGDWAETMKPDVRTKFQWNAYIKRNLRPAKELSAFSQEQLEAGFKKIRRAERDEGWLKKVTLETLLKFVT